MITDVKFLNKILANPIEQHNKKYMAKFNMLHICKDSSILLILIDYIISVKRIRTFGNNVKECLKFKINICKLGIVFNLIKKNTLRKTYILEAFHLKLR